MLKIDAILEDEDAWISLGEMSHMKGKMEYNIAFTSFWF
jgi:hypothetical protein